MYNSTSLRDIVLENPSNCPHLAWSRQQRSAEAISSRFDNGYDTLLLADEVGMGKTYVALTVMAKYLFQNTANNRKILLITPPSLVLREKWQQEIQSFNEQYLTPVARSRKTMQAIVINNYWDLLRNLKDFESRQILRVNEDNRLCFTWCIFNWAFTRGLLGKKRRILWPSISTLDRHESTVSNFLANFSEHAIWRFLDKDFSIRAHFYQGLFHSLKNDFDGSMRARLQSYSHSDVANIVKRFANEQDKHEPNIYIIGMNSLTRPRIDHPDNKFFSMYILAHLLFRRQRDTKIAHAKFLTQFNILPDEFSDKHTHRWKFFVAKMDSLTRGDFYGLRNAVLDVIKKTDVQFRWRPISEAIVCGNADAARDAQYFFNELGNQIFKSQLAQANIGLAVIDEVHNWKGGAHGAQAFRDLYAPGIRNKLMMSATPFQMEEGELGRLFSFVQRHGGLSEAVMKELSAPSGEISRCIASSSDFSESWRTLSAFPNEAQRLHDLFDISHRDTVKYTAAKIANDNAETIEMRSFAASLITYLKSISALQKKLIRIVIRHTKGREKRNFHIGQDFDRTECVNPRNSLYPTEGYANREDAIVNFIGMRLGQLIQREENKSFEANARLLSGLTSSKAAFRASSDQICKTTETKGYYDMFERILDERQHPKVAATVERAFRNFESGRKTLIFCERVPTLTECKQELKTSIENFINTHGKSSTNERKNLLNRRDIIENIWWNSLWDALDCRTLGKDLLLRYLPDAQNFAINCIERTGVYPSARRIINLLDTWLINCASNEYHTVLSPMKPALIFFNNMASALKENLSQDTSILRDFLRPKYGKGHEETIEDGFDGEVTTNEKFDLKSVRSAVKYISLHQYIERKNIWFMEDYKEFHELLWHLLVSESKQLQKCNDRDIHLGNETQTAMVFYDLLEDLMIGIRKFTLRDDLLVRYERSSQAKTSIERIADGIKYMRIGHDISMLKRVTRFLSNLIKADGSISRAGLTQSKRKSLWQGVSISRVGFIATLDGSTPRENRTALCAAFNSPLLPDILICTSIGSEGIDLHQQCADVIHHDLPWNPAKLEQRNGRVDRVGSLAQASEGLFINIGIPFLANNYEQYQYQKVYSRAQKFEILLGKPEFDSCSIEEEVYNAENEEKIVESQIEVGNDDAILVPLPHAVVNALQLNLAVDSVDAIPN